MQVAIKKLFNMPPQLISTSISCGVTTNKFKLDGISVNNSQ